MHPLQIKKITEKLIFGVMIKGQIQTAVIEDVPAELEKSKDDTIKRTFTFDRNTDIGPIQIGDRCHACVSSDDLNPLKVNNVKKVVKKFNTPNPLSAR